MTVIWAGLAVGSIYAVVALTLNLPLAQAGVFNIAQPQILVFGLFLSYSGIVTFGLPPWVVIVGCAFVCALLAVLVELVAIRPLLSDSNHGTLVTTVGALTVLQGLIIVIWGVDPYGMEFIGGTTPLTLLGGRLVPADLAMIIIAFAVALGLNLLATRTRWGLSGQAATEDPDTAKARGVNVPFLRVGSLALAGAIAGAVAVVVAAQVSISNEVGFRLLIYGFVALIVGGVGSFWGSWLGGIAIGLVDALAALYLGSQWSAPIIFAILLTVLLVKPSGLFGRAHARLI